LILIIIKVIVINVLMIRRKSIDQRVNIHIKEIQIKMIF